MVTASVLVLEILPAPKTIMAKLAPKAAALDMPRVDGEASGFLRLFCMTQPATDNPAPAIIAASILGRRIRQITTSDTLLPFPKIDWIT